MNFKMSWSPRIRLGVLIVFALSLVGLRFRWLGPEAAAWFQANAGYYVVLALVLLSAISFTRLAAASGWLTGGFWHPHRAAVGAILMVTVFLHLHEPHVMRVIYDEPSHALVSLVMHTEKHVMVASQSNYYGDTLVLTNYYPSFRQYLFPLLVSLLHDFTGYRVANVFVLNFMLTPVVLLAAYFLGVKLRGRLAGGVAVALLATLPLFAQNVTSGGYDVLNLALLGGLILSALSYVQAPDSERRLHMDLSLAFALLLTVARSESILYLVPWALMVVAVWWRERRVELTGFAVVSPLFLLPSLMCNMVLMNLPYAMDARAREDGKAFFDLGNLPEHLSNAAEYLFEFDRSSTASGLLAVIGLVGFVALLARADKLTFERRFRSTEWIVMFFSSFVALIYLFILTNFWGSPTDPMASRFCLPLMFVWSVIGGWFVVQFRGLKARPAVVFGVLALWCVIMAAPSMSRGVATHSLRNSRGEEWFIRFAETQDRTQTLFVAQSNLGLIARKYAASESRYARAYPEAFIRALKAKLYRDVFVFQTWSRAPKTDQWRLDPGHVALDNLVLESLEEREITPFYRVRISRLLGYRKSDGTVVTAASDQPEVNLKESFANESEWYAYKLSLYP